MADRTASLNFSRRPFRDERPVLLVITVASLLAAILLAVNLRLYLGYQNTVAGTSRQIAYLQGRKTDATRRADEARRALESYRVSSLAVESQGLLRIVAERRFSWTAVLARLERVLPADVRVSRLAPHFDKQGATIAMGLVGKDADSVVATIAALARDPAFSVINLNSETTPEQGVPEGRSFDVNVRYTPANEAAR